MTHKGSDTPGRRRQLERSCAAGVASSRMVKHPDCPAPKIHVSMKCLVRNDVTPGALITLKPFAFNRCATSSSSVNHLLSPCQNRALWPEVHLIDVPVNNSANRPRAAGRSKVPHNMHLVGLGCSSFAPSVSDVLMMRKG
jgi:hypothetical protein